MKVANALCAGGGEVARDKAADPNVLRGMDQILLLWDVERVDSANDYINAAEGLGELLHAVVDIPDADIETGCTELSNVRLLGRGGTNKCSKPLQRGGIVKGALDTREGP